MEENYSSNNDIHNTKIEINNQIENSIHPNPAAIDLNIINITSINNSISNNLSTENIPPFSNISKDKNSNNDNYEQIIENEKIRKASCDISLFDSDQNIEKENFHQNSNDDSCFSRISIENQRNDRINLHENDNFSRESNEKIKKCLLTSKYKYIGETVDEKRDGFGICEYSKGKVYIGMFKNDKKDGYGKIIHASGDEEYVEFSNGLMKGFYQCFKKDNSKITSYVNEKKFSEFIVLEKNNILYEGEPQTDENTKISFGKLVIKKEKSKKIFIGNVFNYQTEVGFGLFYKDNNLFYGEIKNKVMTNYIENYSSEGGCFLGFLKDSKKNGIGLSFLKDGRVCLGEFEDDQKKGPIFIFTLAKPSVKMELFLMGFKTKTVEKMDTIKKYLQLNYPEFCNILKIDFDKLIQKLSPEINQEISISSKLIESLKND